jgi:hypothetical protein
MGLESSERIQGVAGGEDIVSQNACETQSPDPVPCTI